MRLMPRLGNGHSWVTGIRRSSIINLRFESVCSSMLKLPIGPAHNDYSRAAFMHIGVFFIVTTIDLSSPLSFLGFCERPEIAGSPRSNYVLDALCASTRGNGPSHLGGC